MSKSISSGVKSIVEKLSENNKLKQWRLLRTQLDNILIVNNLMSSDETRAKCAAIDQLSLEDRKSYISNTWGPNYLERAMPMLLQLKLLESSD